MTTKASTLLDQLQRLVAPMALRSAPDAELLSKFATNQDQLAFAVLIDRHGPMVLNVCRRIIGNSHSAEDAYQAVFMVLAKKAGSLRVGSSLAPWLYGVAYRVALKARRAANSKRASASMPADDALVDPRPDPLAELSARDLLRFMEEDIQRLPKSCRLSVALCCLDSLTVKATARRLGLTETTVKGNLQRGRAKLHARLVRRGLTLSAGLAVLEAARGYMWAAPPKLLAAKTLKAGLAFAAANQAALSDVPEAVLQLAKMTSKSSSLLKLKLACVAAVMAGVTALGAGGLTTWDAESGQDESRQEKTNLLLAQVSQPKPKGENQRLDIYGDPLPPGALARLGSLWLRHGRYVSGLAFSADGKTLISAGSDNTIRFWDVAGVKSRVVSLEKPAEKYIATELSPDGKLFAGWDQKAIMLWDTETGKQVKQIPAPKWERDFGPRGYLYFSADCQTIVAADQFLIQHKLWNLKDGTETALKTPRPEDEGYYHTDSSAHATLSPDGKLLAVGHWSGKPMSVWEVASGKRLYSLDAHATYSRFSPDGKILAVASSNRGIAAAEYKLTLHLKEAATGKEIQQMPLPGKDFGNICWEIAYSPDGKVIIPVTREAVYLRDSGTGKILKTIADWQAGGQRGVALSPDGQILASACGNQIQVWDSTTGEYLHRRPGADDPSGIAFSATGRHLAIGTWIGPKFSVWDTHTGKSVRVLKVNRDNAYVRYLSYSADGNSLVVGGHNGHIESLDVATGNLQSIVDLHNSETHFYSLSPDGRRVITANRDFRLSDHHSTVKVWETAPVKLVASQTFAALSWKRWAAMETARRS